ncbi:hypothetical protein HGA88_06035 [Candidatus Roizmanbacteria bacterium]|nr:hypothetical protein [Candidatus Roizmanbacteria bacterium]
MITSNLIQTVQDFVYKEIEITSTPSRFQLDYTNDKGQLLAEKLQADKNIVLLGTLLMDCKLGQAFKEGRLKDHIEMSVQRAEELLSQDGEITSEEKEIVLACVREHHGAEKFSSLEAEICCNADCYRFISVEGVIGSIYHWQEKMPIEKLISLFREKAEEKWNALSLDMCRKELEPEYKAVKHLLDCYKGE